VRFKPIKAVIRHPLDETLFAVRTAYGRNVRVTSSHSVFVQEEGAIRLKRGDALRVGDRVVAPGTLRLPAQAPAQLDLLERCGPFLRQRSRYGCAARPCKTGVALRYCKGMAQATT